MRNLLFLFFALIFSIERTSAQVDVNQPLEVYVGGNIIVLSHLQKQVVRCQPEQDTKAHLSAFSSSITDLSAQNFCTVRDGAVEVIGFCNSNSQGFLTIKHEGEKWYLQGTRCGILSVGELSRDGSYVFPAPMPGKTVSFSFSVDLSKAPCDFINFLEELTRKGEKRKEPTDKKARGKKMSIGGLAQAKPHFRLCCPRGTAPRCFEYLASAR